MEEEPVAEPPLDLERMMAAVDGLAESMAEFAERLRAGFGRIPDESTPVRRVSPIELRDGLVRREPIAARPRKRRRR